MPTPPAPVLVTGATGRQGGATARALLAAGVPVRALVRDPSGLRARAAGVPQFVHTSVTGAGQHTGTPGWADWAARMGPTMDAKAAVQDRVREAGFARWTLLKPGFFMENFLPEMAFLFPRGIEGGLVSVVRPGTRLSLVAVRDIGAAAAAAIAAPERFDGVELELASDHLSMAEIAEVLSRTLDVPLAAPDMTEEEATAAGMPPPAASHAWLNVAEQPGRPEYARDLGIPLTSFADWARQQTWTEGVARRTPAGTG